MGKYKCTCGATSDQEEWNNATKEALDSDDIYLIEDEEKDPTSLFICPKCGASVGLDGLEVSHD